jgi:hypothetical protein
MVKKKKGKAWQSSSDVVVLQSCVAKDCEKIEVKVKRQPFQKIGRDLIPGALMETDHY